MRKNILTLMATIVMGTFMLTSCSEKSVVPPKQPASAASTKGGTGNTTGTGSTTATSQNTGGHSCGNGYGSQSSGG